jgi:hypothetical protein
MLNQIADSQNDFFKKIIELQGDLIERVERFQHSTLKEVVLKFSRQQLVALVASLIGEQGKTFVWPPLAIDTASENAARMVISAERRVLGS